MNDEPNWQPIEMLPVMNEAIEDMYESSKALINSLETARSKPHVLDDETVNRVIRVHSEQLELNPVYLEQMKRWENEINDAESSKQLAENERKLVELQSIDVLILGIATEISGSTIDEILQMDDVELAIKSLSNKQDL